MRAVLVALTLAVAAASAPLCCTSPKYTVEAIEQKAEIINGSLRSVAGDLVGLTGFLPPAPRGAHVCSRTLACRWPHVGCGGGAPSLSPVV